MDTLEFLSNKVKGILKLERNIPLKIAIMGQTGVGKSSLINALFNAGLDTNPIRPTTKEITPIEVPVKNAPNGSHLIFYDLPGIGESREADVQYLQHYQQMLLESDIVIWAIHADSRSFTFDLESLHKVFGTMEKEKQAKLISRVTFVLTKADLLTPSHPSPWILAKLEKECIFVPQENIEHLLEQKEEHLRKHFIDPYRDLIDSQTYYEGNFDIDEPGFSCNKDTVTYKGILDREKLQNLKKRFPQQSAVFDRLYDNYRVISCSSRFRFNLDLLMRVIVTKLSSSTITRFSNFYQESVMDKLTYNDATQFRNFIVLDQDTGSIVFDLAKTDL